MQTFGGPRTFYSSFIHSRAQERSTPHVDIRGPTKLFHSSCRHSGAHERVPLLMQTFGGPRTCSTPHADIRGPTKGFHSPHVDIRGPTCCTSFSHAGIRGYCLICSTTPYVSSNTLHGSTEILLLYTVSLAWKHISLLFT